jgi:hypothetical protein
MKDLFTIKTLSDCASCNDKIIRSKKMIQNKNPNYTGLSDSISDIIGGIFNYVFGSVDRGHWEGALFIPGDLNSRISKTQAWIQNSGLAQFAYEPEWMLILKTPGIWQENIGRYIDIVLRGRSKGTIPRANINNTLPTEAGIFGDIGIVPLLLLGGIVFSVMSSTTKKRRVSK